GPRRAVERIDIAEDEAFGRRPIAEIEGDVAHRVRPQRQVAGSAPGRRRDRAEAIDHDVGRRPADALLPALLQLARREALAAHLAGEIAVAGHDEGLSMQADLPLLPSPTPWHATIAREKTR